MQKYDQYKYSGVAWLGDVPKHWILTKIKYIAELTPSKSEITDIEKECSFIPMEKLKLGNITLDENRIIRDVINSYTYFKNGDLLIAKVTPCFENKNFAIAENLVNGIGFGSSEIYVLRPKICNVRYLFYRLQENAFMELATGSMTGAGGLKRISSDFLNNFTIAMPPLTEQTTIATFLDKRTAYIDRLIAKQQTLSEKLSEKRTALIIEAVCGRLFPSSSLREPAGLDEENRSPNTAHPAPLFGKEGLGEINLKDSGIQWLGKVPEHWEVKRLKFVGKLQGGIGFPHDYQNVPDLEFGFYKVGDLGLSENNRDMPKAQHTVSIEIANKLGAKIIHKNSILYAKVGAALLLNRRRITSEKCCIDNNMTAFIPNLKQILPIWAFYTLSIIDFKTLVNPGAIPSLSEGYQENLFIPVPNLAEQSTIATFLDKETAKIDRLQAKIAESIARLKEYRSALITQTVTGKIKV